jgi:hypothetical protein
MGVVDDEFGPEVDDTTIEGVCMFPISAMSACAFVSTTCRSWHPQNSKRTFSTVADNVSRRVQGRSAVGRSSYCHSVWVAE